mmetsp:Transcript_6416/g.16597  ORF Transcript_6416/g.16597 Transcript_6416/m.16597 type:complete len:211 (-) Transcript_6416:184-816(-)
MRTEAFMCSGLLCQEIHSTENAPPCSARILKPATFPNTSSPRIAGPLLARTVAGACLLSPCHTVRGTSPCSPARMPWDASFCRSRTRITHRTVPSSCEKDTTTAPRASPRSTSTEETSSSRRDASARRARSTHAHRLGTTRLLSARQRPRHCVLDQQARGACSAPKAGLNSCCLAEGTASCLRGTCAWLAAGRWLLRLAACLTAEDASPT